MDVTKFINSKSIARYLDEIKYEFNALEAAYLIWQCKSATLNEKFSGWEEVIYSMPDMSVKKRRWGWATDEPSLHAFLKRYIQYYKEKIKRFYEDDSSLYLYKVFFDCDSSWYIDERIFTSLKFCEKAVEEEIKDGDVKYYVIKKLVPNGGDYIELTFDKNGDICDIYAVESKISDKKANDITLYFEGLWLKLPTPFKRGDIVYQPNTYAKPNPFVLLDMSTWGEEELRENGVTDEKIIAQHTQLIEKHLPDGDESDMNVNGYFMDDYGRMYWDHTTDNYLNLEYYDGKLEGKYRFLNALSNYEKKKIDLALFTNTYMIFADEVRYENIKKHSYFTEEELKLAGLK